MSWIFFDQSAGKKLGQDLGLAPSDMHEASGDAVLCALEQPRPSVVLLPGETPDRVVLLQVRRPRVANANAAGDGHEPVTYRSSGFLGLNDEPIYFDDDSQPQPRRRWWQRKGK
jgi:hypothetical protein